MLAMIVQDMKAHVRLRVPPQEIGEATPPREILAFHGRWFISPRCLERASLVRGRFGFSFFLGLYRHCDLLLENGHKVQGACLFTVLPNPLFFFTHHKLSIHAALGDVFVHWQNSAIPETQRPPAPFEVEIRDSQRARYLSTSALAFIEEREDGRSKLMKDKTDGRLWQWLKIAEGQEALFQVNVNQWSYRFIEMRELKKARQAGQQLDQEAMLSYFQTLQDDPQQLPCQETGCTHPRARFSTLCREHHFEAIMGVAVQELKR